MKYAKKLLGCHKKKEKKDLDHFQTTYEADFRYTTLFKYEYTKYTKTTIGVPSKKIKLFRPLPDNLGSWFSVYNLIQIWIDEIYKNNNWGTIKKMGVPSKKNKKNF